MIKRWLKACDWKFLTALSVLLMVVYLVWAGYSTVLDNRKKSDRIDILIAATERKDAESSRERDLAARERKVAARERADAARERKEFIAYTKALAERQRALLAYLRSHGIDIPVRFVTQIEPPRIETRRVGRKTYKPSPRKAPSTSSSPGKSGSAPAKGRKNNPGKGRR